MSAEASAWRKVVVGTEMLADAASALDALLRNLEEVVADYEKLRRRDLRGRHRAPRLLQRKK